MAVYLKGKNGGSVSAKKKEAPDSYAANANVTAKGGKTYDQRSTHGGFYTWGGGNRTFDDGYVVYSDGKGGYFGEYGGQRWETDGFGNRIDTSYAANGSQSAASAVTEYENALAENQKAYSEAKETAYKYADMQKNATMGYAQRSRSLALDSAARQKEIAYASAEAYRSQGAADAEISRQRAVVDADTSYRKNLATYGERAEALGDMGLGTSGYSDYIAAQAYAAARGEKQAANAAAEKTNRALSYEEYLQKMNADLSEEQSRYNAEAQYEGLRYGAETSEIEAKRTADLSYMANAAEGRENLAKYKTEKAESEKEYARNAFASLLNAANNGEYTPEQVQRLAFEYGLTNDQAQMLEAAAKKYTEKTAEADSAVSYQEMMSIKSDIDSGATYTDKDIERLVKEKAVTKKDAEEIASYRDDAEVSEARTIASAMKNGTPVSDSSGNAVYVTVGAIAAYLEELERAHESGHIGDDAYGEIKEMLPSSGKVAGGWSLISISDRYLTFSMYGGSDHRVGARVGKKVDDTASTRYLNKLATGDEEKSPDGKATASGSERGERIVEAFGKTYYYSNGSWRELIFPS